MSVPEILEILGGEIGMYKRSYREADGKIRDRSVLRTIKGLQQASLLILSASSASLRLRVSKNGKAGV